VRVTASAIPPVTAAAPATGASTARLVITRQRSAAAPANRSSAARSGVVSPAAMSSSARSATSLP
jgi:hypothetical protein